MNGDNDWKSHRGRPLDAAQKFTGRSMKPDQEAAVGISGSDGDERTTTSGLEEEKEEEEEEGGGREDGDVTATGVSLGGGDLADIPPARLVERPGLNYDRIARILSAG